MFFSTNHVIDSSKLSKKIKPKELLEYCIFRLKNFCGNVHHILAVYIYRQLDTKYIYYSIRTALLV